MGPETVVNRDKCQAGAERRGEERKQRGEGGPSAGNEIREENEIKE